MFLLSLFLNFVLEMSNTFVGRMKQEWYAIAALAKLNHDVSRDKVVKSVCAHMHEKASHAAKICEHQEENALKKQWEVDFFALKEAQLAATTTAATTTTASTEVSVSVTTTNNALLDLPAINLPEISNLDKYPHGIWIDGKHYTNSPLKPRESLVKAETSPVSVLRKRYKSETDKIGAPQTQMQAPKQGKGKSFYYTTVTNLLGAEADDEEGSESPTY